MSYPVSIPATSNHKAIEDALLRLVLGIDTNDFELFKSGFFDHDSCIFEMNGNAMVGLDAINKNMFATVGPLETTHFITNARVVEEATDSATFTCSALANHFRPGEGLQPDSQKLLSGSLYRVDVAKKDGLWKVKKWSMKLIWIEGDGSIVAPK